MSPNSPPSGTTAAPSAPTNRFFPNGHGPTLQGVADLIQHPDTRNIMILAGAGISTSADPPIPDFRTKGTGLYDNLAKYHLPYPEAIFDIGYFQDKPQAFFTLAKELYPGNFRPSLTHYFFRLLERKRKLGCVFTQNVDTLERIAGVSAGRVVEAHGSFATAACVKCRTAVEPDWMRAKVMAGEIARCPSKACRKRGQPGLVKPDIVFFGEGLPARFFERIKDLRKADLLIVVGTSLQVQPFASLIDAVPSTCPRVLINLERVGELAAYDTYGGMRGRMNESGFDFHGVTCGGRLQTRDVYWEGRADDRVRLLARALGWEEELVTMREEHFKQLDAEWGGRGKAGSSAEREALDVARKADQTAARVSRGAASPPRSPEAAEGTTTPSRIDAMRASEVGRDSAGSKAEKGDDPTEGLVSALEKTKLDGSEERGGGKTEGKVKKEGL